jgi:hypothetical protein
MDTFWIETSPGTYFSADDAYEVEVYDDGTVFVCDYSGEEGADSDEYDDEDDGLNPNVVKNEFPDLQSMVDYYACPTSGLPLTQ